MFEVNSRSYPTSLNMITLHTCPYSCRGVCLNKLATPFDETIRVFCFFHPLVEVDLPPFVDDFHHEIKVTLDWEAFISTLVHSPRLFYNGLSCMVYELLQDYFVLDDSTSGFNLFFEVCGHIAWVHVPPSLSCLFFTS